jgi:hypothetical protein
MTTINTLVNNQTNAHHSNLPRTAAEKTQDKATTLAADNVDKFDASSVNVNRNFQHSPERAEQSGLSVHGYRGKTALQMKNAIVADFARHNIARQAGGDFWNNILNATFTPRPFALGAFNAAEATSAKHEDYWGVEATAERLFTFARTLAGDRDDLFDTMKNAFLKGFNLAAGAAGARGKLPDISHQTKERVLELFDEWEAEIAARRNPQPAESEKSEK